MSLALCPAASVSSSSTPQIFRDVTRLWWLLCPPVYLLSLISSSSCYKVQSQHIKEATTTTTKASGCRNTRKQFPTIQLTQLNKAILYIMHISVQGLTFYPKKSLYLTRQDFRKQSQRFWPAPGNASAGSGRCVSAIAQLINTKR